MDPFTIAAGIGALGSLFKGFSGLSAGNQEAQADRYAAQQAQDEAGVSAQQALVRGNATAADAAVQAAANGGGFVGSSLTVISSLARQAMFNARAALYKGQVDARNDLYNADVAKRNGVNAAISGGIGAASSLIGGFAESAAVGRQMRAISALRGDAGYADVGP